MGTDNPARLSRVTDDHADAVRALVRTLCPDANAVPVWDNPLGGRTLRLDGAGPVHYLKVAPTSLPDSHHPHLEAERISWTSGRLPVPSVQACGQDQGLSWMLTRALPGRPASDPAWLSDPLRLVRALARGVRSFHDGLADRAAQCPWRWDIAHRLATGTGSEAARRMATDAPPESDPVVAHGDLCAPNVLLSDGWEVLGFVDLGKLGVADRAADLGTLQWSLEYNGYGELTEDFLAAYGWRGERATVQWYRDFYTVA